MGLITSNRILGQIFAEQKEVDRLYQSDIKVIEVKLIIANVAERVSEVAIQETQESLLNEIERLLTELGRCERQFEHLADMASRITSGNISHHRACIMGNAKNNAEFIGKHFTRPFIHK